MLALPQYIPLQTVFYITMTTDFLQWFLNGFYYFRCSYTLYFNKYLPFRCLIECWDEILYKTIYHLLVFTLFQLLVFLFIDFYINEDSFSAEWWERGTLKGLIERTRLICYTKELLNSKLKHMRKSLLL